MESNLNYYDQYLEVQNVVRNNPSNNEIYPHFEGFQLIGDSLFCRFANEVLNQPSKVVDGVRLIGLCVSGQRIDQLRHRIKKNTYPLAPRVMVLIGTNDVLCGGDTEAMIRHFKRLLKLLLNRNVKKLVILTLPPIPKFCVSFSHWSVIRTYNDFLKGLDNDSNIRVYDICPLYTKFLFALKFEISEICPSLKKSNSLERKTDSPATSRSSSSSSSLERKKSPFVAIERPFATPTIKKVNDLCNKIHRSRKSLEQKSINKTKDTDETKIKKEIKLTEEVKSVEETKETIKKEKKYKANRTAEIIKTYDSDEDKDEDENEDKSNLNLCSKSLNVPSPELSTKETAMEMETPAVKKGIKRKIWVDKNAKFDDNGNLAFNNKDDESLINDGGPITKKRKTAKSDPEPESQSPSRELRKKLSDPNRAAASMFSRALTDIIKKDRVSPSKQGPAKSTVDKLKNLDLKVNLLENKNVKVKEESTTVIATDPWKIENLKDEESDDEESEEMAYNSQDEGEFKNNDEESDPETASPKNKPKELSDFQEFVKMTNEELTDEEDSLEDDDDFTNITITKTVNDIKEEPAEEETEHKENEDISDGEIFDDDDDYKAESEVESETSDDGSHQKQMWPFIEFQFADVVKQHLNLVSTLEGTSEAVSYTNYLNQAYNFEPAPQMQHILQAQRYSMEFCSPLSTSPLNPYYKSSPYYYNTPPSSAPSTPPPMPSPVSSPFGDYNQSGKLDLEGLPARDKNIVELSKYIVTLDSYEVLYSFGQKRLDMIHLNFHGLTRLKNFLSLQFAKL